MKAHFNKRQYSHPDLTRIENGQKSVGAQLEDIIANIHKYNLIQLKEKFYNILDDKETYVSPIKANMYKENTKRIYSLREMQRFLTNIYLSAANLNVT